MIDKKEYGNLPLEELNDKFVEVCSCGNLEMVRYLLTSSELKECVDIHLDEDLGFGWACNNGHLEIVRYLLSSQELKEHADIHARFNEGFRCACVNGHLDIVKYLVFEIGIEKTERIEEFLLYDDKNGEISKLFKIRDLNSTLDKKLDNKVIGQNKKIKL